jgi:hypothetical protein
MTVSTVAKLHMNTKFNMETEANGLLPYVLVTKELDGSLGLSVYRCIAFDVQAKEAAKEEIEIKEQLNTQQIPIEQVHNGEIYSSHIAKTCSIYCTVPRLYASQSLKENMASRRNVHAEQYLPQTLTELCFTELHKWLIGPSLYCSSSLCHIR